MRTYDDDDAMAFHLQCQPAEPELGFSSHSDVQEELFRKFQILGLKSDTNDGVVVNENLVICGGPDGSCVLPVRPYAIDCPHFVRTGTCKFGVSCRFNHPVNRSSQAVNQANWSLEKAAQIECKYYLTAGGCKYGASCRYNHSKAESVVVAPQLNFLGLPIRLGEKDCPYYMRNGSCGYGARCVFHHPEPISVEGGLDPLNPTLSDKFMMQSSQASGSFDSEPASLCLPGALSSSTSPYQNDSSTYMNVNSFPQGMHKHTDLKDYLASDFPAEKRQTDSTPGANSADVLKPEISLQVEEFPARPGQPVCAFFLKTGDCKFKSACRFHHPKDRASTSDACVLSEKGLPLRPDKNVCRHYERFGICKFGRACLFDHPENHTFSSFSKLSTSKPSSGHDSG